MQLCDPDVGVNFKIYTGLSPCHSFNNTFLADERVSLRAVVFTGTQANVLFVQPAQNGRSTLIRLLMYSSQKES